MIARIRKSTPVSSDDARPGLADALLLPLAMTEGMSGRVGDMVDMDKYTGNHAPHASDKEPLRLFDILLLPVAVPIVIVTFVVSFVCVLLLDGFLALKSVKTPRRVIPDTNRDAQPTRDASRPPIVAVPPSPVLAGSSRG